MAAHEGTTFMLYVLIVAATPASLNCKVWLPSDSPLTDMPSPDFTTFHSPSPSTRYSYILP